MESESHDWDAKPMIPSRSPQAWSRPLEFADFLKTNTGGSTWIVDNRAGVDVQEYCRPLSLAQIVSG